MGKKRATIFIIIAVAVAAGVSIPLGLSGLNSTTQEKPTNGVLSPADNGGGNNSTGFRDPFRVIPDSNPPGIKDAGLKVEKVVEGLALPTSMAFLENGNMLILQKDNGNVRLVSNGTLQDAPVHDEFVEKNSERGLLGIAVAGGGNGTKTVFLYYTEADGGEVRNRVYRYNWTGEGNFTGKTLILDLPGTPGPNHDGGKLAIGPDGMLYAVIGDLNRNGMLQNYGNGAGPDGTSVILRTDFDGNAPGDNPLSDSGSPVNSSISRYYAYGIRNSFGMDFDPVTGRLWDTENGPTDYDEINLVKPGFNSGWEQVMGPIERTGKSDSSLVQFEGSQYADPAFSWRAAQGITDIEFLNSTSLGNKYAGNIFVGDINNGNLYYFAVNGSRDGLVLDRGLSDRVADNSAEVGAVTFGTGFGGITDIETGPDGYLYILTFSGNVYRIVPNSHA